MDSVFVGSTYEEPYGKGFGYWESSLALSLLQSIPGVECVVDCDFRARLRPITNDPRAENGPPADCTPMFLQIA